MGRRGSRIALTRVYKKLHTEVAVLRISIRGLGDNFCIVGYPYLIALRQSCSSTARNRQQGPLNLSVLLVTRNTACRFIGAPRFGLKHRATRAVSTANPLRSWKTPSLVLKDFDVSEDLQTLCGDTRSPRSQTTAAQ